MADRHTERLNPDPEGVRRAASLLRSGALVALPTETVYGLGADAGNERAVARIYEAKGRPSFNPLIVHVDSVAQARTLVEWPEAAESVARSFWPGPLTLVLPIRPGARVSRLATAGLDTLAIRLPDRKVARAVIRAAGRPVAAPSANPSGRISPTTADHVLAGLDGRIAAVLDDGPCAVGVESTILSLADAPTLLRPGAVTQAELEKALGIAVAHHTGGAISAPGQLESHYAPRARVRLEAATWAPGEARLGFGDVACDLNLSPSGDLTEAAANLFAHLHALDAGAAETIAVSPIPDTALGVAINDRLRRAAAPKPPA